MNWTTKFFVIRDIYRIYPLLTISYFQTSKNGLTERDFNCSSKAHFENRDESRYLEEVKKLEKRWKRCSKETTLKNKTFFCWKIADILIYHRTETNLTKHISNFVTMWSEQSGADSFVSNTKRETLSLEYHLNIIKDFDPKTREMSYDTMPFQTS